jgi:dienelactone hydrolase
VVVLVGLGLPAVGCTSGGKAAAPDDIGPVAGMIGGAGADDATFGRRGPFAVGITTLDLADGRRVELFYPADEDEVDGAPKVTYDVTSGMSEALASRMPQFVKLPKEVNAHRDLAVSDVGPFPVVLFSHGYAGWRTLYATLLSDLASWGFVVASPDMPDHRLEDLLNSQIKPWDAAADVPMLQATLDRVIDEGMSDGRLAKAVDGGKVAVVGHSVGGGDAYRMLAGDDRVSGGVSWNYTLPEDAGGKPFMIIGGETDPTTPNIDEDFTELTGPARLVVVSDGGSGSPTDICEGIDTTNGLLGRANLLGFQLPAEIDEAVRSGCSAGDVSPRTAQTIILHFTVAHLRDALVIGTPGVGLGPDVVGDLPGLVVYQQRNIPE